MTGRLTLQSISIISASVVPGLTVLESVYSDFCAHIENVRTYALTDLFLLTIVHKIITPPILQDPSDCEYNYPALFSRM